MAESTVAARPELLTGPPTGLGHLGRGALWVLLGRVVGIASTVLVNILLARLLSPADFGNFVLIASIMALASCLAMGGQNTAVVRFVAENLGRRDFVRARQTLALIFRVVILGTVVVALLAFVALHFGGLALLGLPSAGSLAAIIVVGLALLALLQIASESLRGLQEFRLASLFSGGQAGGLVSNLIFLGLLSVAVAAGRVTLTSTLLLNLSAMAIVLPWALIALRRTARARLPIGSAPVSPRPALTVRELGLVSLPLLLIQLLTFVTAQSDLWIAGIFCPHDQLALYGAARRLMLLVAMPMQIANLTILATVAELHFQGRRAELERVLRSTASLVAIPSLSALLLLIFCGGPTLSLLFGPFYAEAALPLAILSAGQLCLVGVGCCGCTLEMTGHQNGSLLVNLVAALAFAVAGPLATAYFGLVGLSITSASVVAVQSIALWWLARVRVGVWTHAVPWFWQRVEVLAAEPGECAADLSRLDPSGQETLVMNHP